MIRKLYHLIRFWLRKIPSWDFVAIRQMLQNAVTADALLRAANRDTYCTQIIGRDRVYGIVEYWPHIREDVEFLEKVLVMRYLDKNIFLNERERKIAQDTITQVGAFMRRAYDEKRFIAR